MSAAKFPLGRLVATPNALQSIPSDEMLVALRRHVIGDWGDLSAHDRQENEVSLTEGFRLLSAYRTRRGVTFWIITEADRTSTTVLLPQDY